jgi:hypothetical protein
METIWGPKMYWKWIIRCVRWKYKYFVWNMEHIRTNKVKKKYCFLFQWLITADCKVSMHVYVVLVSMSTLSCMSRDVNLSPTGWIFIRFDIGYFQKCQENSNVVKLDICIEHFTWRPDCSLYCWLQQHCRNMPIWIRWHEAVRSFFFLGQQHRRTHFCIPIVTRWHGWVEVFCFADVF